MIEILAPGLLSTIQDLGRTGLGSLGVGRTGAMDRLALQLANAMLGNDCGAAAVEITVGGFECKVLERVDICLAGADCKATLDGKPLPRWWVQTLLPGQVLRTGFSTTGMRGYVGFLGGLDVPSVLGSASTDMKGGFGGLDGHALKKGDRLAARTSSRQDRPLAFGLSPSVWETLFATLAVPTVLRFIPAAEWGDYDEDNQARFTSSDWTITQDSNRVGYRLDGPEIVPKVRKELLSHGILPGTIQLPPSGKPVIQLADANTAGGYPKLGVVIEEDLSLLAQARLGSSLRFVPCSLADAREARETQRQLIEDVRKCAMIHLPAPTSPSSTQETSHEIH
ncbi:biotin-dependent carboxyltransferase family protein [uncultured Cohaesibacter sp.]|uniref:5-oxoprolinase subunit C family protein n=1 Tax=uncultured Cohaesibacter sp. TaxID=1002546 RepID=UPI0029C6022C|nr:biotin-dependent carboxyltransferase family protein [uncultured Cohaesibacter sp.]